MWISEGKLSRTQVIFRWYLREGSKRTRERVHPSEVLERRARPFCFCNPTRAGEAARVGLQKQNGHAQKIVSV
jgi:hypothetical protein